MITKATSENKALIEARFAQITEAFATNVEHPEWHSITINSFNDYFSHIEEINALPTNFVDKTGQPVVGKYFLMPLDEPLFEIDANSRSIAVPSEFSRNGVGVKGDHQAETLYFRVDRYFDHQDLFAVDDIVINWQFTPVNGSRNADAPIQTSKAFAPDEEFDPGHVVFGWVIDKTMTPERGTLSFSVNFITYDGTEYAYALNTQTASVNINDSLTLEDPSILATLARPTFNRLRNSSYTPAGLEPLHNPVFVSGDMQVDQSTGKSYYSGLPAVMNFEFNDDDSAIEKDILNLSARANSIDAGGIVQYTWRGSPEISAELIPSVMYEEVSHSKDIAKDSFEVYYLGVENEGEMSYTKLTATSNPTLDTAWNDDEQKIFVQNSVQPINQGGNYTVSARTTCTTLQGERELTSTSRAVESIACLIPQAAKPAVSISIDPESVAQIANEMTDFDVPYIQNSDARNYAFINNDATPQIIATVSKVDNEPAERSLGAISFKVTSIPVDIVDIDENATYYRFKDEPFIIPASTTAGEYYVYAINRRNHTTGISEVAGPIQLSRVAPKISEVTLRTADTNQLVLLNGANAGTDVNRIVNHHHADGGNYDFAITLPSFSTEEYGEDKPEYSIMVKEVAITVSQDEGKNEIWTVADYIDEGEDNIDEIDLSNEVVNEDGQYYFNVNNDRGYYVIEVTTIYHGTACTTQSDPFKVEVD